MRRQKYIEKILVKRPMARARKSEDPVNHERWLVSYADFITLLFAFFVVMYSVSSVNEGKYRVLSDSLVTAFSPTTRSMLPIQVGKLNRGAEDQTVQLQARSGGLPIAKGLPAPRSKTENGKNTEAKSKHAGIKQISKAIAQAMSELMDKDLVNIREYDDKVEVEMKSSILFPSGSAQLSSQAVPVLVQLAEQLAPFPNNIRVEGFTDNIPISSDIYPSNWELSASRAAGVVNLFSKQGIDPRRLSAVGYGEYQPIASNDTSEGRSKNRRVVLVITADADAEVTKTIPIAPQSKGMLPLRPVLGFLPSTDWADLAMFNAYTVPGSVKIWRFTRSIPG